MAVNIDQFRDNYLSQRAQILQSMYGGGPEPQEVSSPKVSSPIWKTDSGSYTNYAGGGISREEPQRAIGPRPQNPKPGEKYGDATWDPNKGWQGPPETHVVNPDYLRRKEDLERSLVLSRSLRERERELAEYMGELEALKSRRANNPKKWDYNDQSQYERVLRLIPSIQQDIQEYEYVLGRDKKDLQPSTPEGGQTLPAIPGQDKSAIQFPQDPYDQPKYTVPPGTEQVKGTPIYKNPDGSYSNIGTVRGETPSAIRAGIAKREDEDRLRKHQKEIEGIKSGKGDFNKLIENAIKYATEIDNIGKTTINSTKFSEFMQRWASGKPIDVGGQEPGGKPKAVPTRGQNGAMFWGDGAGIFYPDSNGNLVPVDPGYKGPIPKLKKQAVPEPEQPSRGTAIDLRSIDDRSKEYGDISEQPAIYLQNYLPFGKQGADLERTLLDFIRSRKREPSEWEKRNK